MAPRPLPNQGQPYHSLSLSLTHQHTLHALTRILLTSPNTSSPASLAHKLLLCVATMFVPPERSLVSSLLMHTASQPLQHACHAIKVHLKRLWNSSRFVCSNEGPTRLQYILDLPLETLSPPMTMAANEGTMVFHARSLPESCHVTEVAVQNQTRIFLGSRTWHNRAHRPRNNPLG